MTTWLLYGANGYTGELIAREAAHRGLKPVLAGRSTAKIAPLADELGLEHRAFDLDDPMRIARHLADVETVLHCAGPFAATSAPMLEACLQARTHYLDITGEISVFTHAQAQHDRARQAGVVICPGVGFDVIPTDCLAATLAQVLPDATQLRLGFDLAFSLSPGTAKTMVEGTAEGGSVRVDGRIIAVPQAWRTRRIDFGNGAKLAMTVPAADVASAWHTTGIPNIEVYTPAPPLLIRGARLSKYLRPLLARPAVQNSLKWAVTKTVHGPDAQARDAMPVYVWAEAVNAAGERKTARIKTANPYSITVTGTLAAVAFLAGAKPAGGFYTPARLLGADLVTRLPGSGPLSVA